MLSWSPCLGWCTGKPKEFHNLLFDFLFCRSYRRPAQLTTGPKAVPHTEIVDGTVPRGSLLKLRILENKRFLWEAPSVQLSRHANAPSELVLDERFEVCHVASNMEEHVGIERGYASGLHSPHAIYAVAFGSYRIFPCRIPLQV